MRHNFRQDLVSKAALLAGLVMAGLAGAASAQNAGGSMIRPSISFGQTVNGSLNTTDPKDTEGVAQDSFVVRLTAGQSVQVDLTSEAFDPKLEIWGEGINIGDDDDSGPGTNARMRFIAPKAGNYVVYAKGLDSDARGAYTLKVAAPPVRPPMPAPAVMTLGRPSAGTITASSPISEANGDEKRVQRFSFTAQAGQTYRIAANSTDFDIIAAVGRLKAGGSLDAIETDDDGGGSNNALIRFKAPAAGVYVVEVAGVGSEDITGNFQVTATQSPPDRPPSAAKPIGIGQSATGTLADGGARRADGDALFETYSVNLKAGQTIMVRMNKPDDAARIDPVVQIGRGTPSAFEMLAEDDDGGDGLNAKLRYSAPQAGTYLIRTSTSNATSEGAFTLSVSEPPPLSLPPEPLPLALGVTKTGSLESSDPARTGDYYFDRYVFEGQVGETYVIELKSEAFDALVGARHLQRVDDDYETDDDGGEGNNSKLEYTITMSGPQVVRVSSAGAEATGAYSVVLTRK